MTILGIGGVWYICVFNNIQIATYPFIGQINQILSVFVIYQDRTICIKMPEIISVMMF